MVPYVAAQRGGHPAPPAAARRARRRRRRGRQPRGAARPGCGWWWSRPPPWPPRPRSRSAASSGSSASSSPTPSGCVAGPSHRLVLPLLDPDRRAAFLILADLVARTVIAPAELPIGVVTAFVGAPFFVAGPARPPAGPVTAASSCRGRVGRPRRRGRCCRPDPARRAGGPGSALIGPNGVGQDHPAAGHRRAGPARRARSRVGDAAGGRAVAPGAGQARRPGPPEPGGPGRDHRAPTTCCWAAPPTSPTSAPSPGATCDVVASVLDHLDLAACADRRLDSLSGGERQRAVLARALAQQAPVLLLDEPTTGLDVGHQQQVLELVDRLRDDLDLTVVSAMHDLTLAGQFADQLVLLDGGRVAAAGPPATVLTEEVIARHYHASVRVLEDPGGGIVVVPVRHLGREAGGSDEPTPSRPPVDPPERPARRRRRRWCWSTPATARASRRPRSGRAAGGGPRLEGLRRPVPQVGPLADRRGGDRPPPRGRLVPARRRLHLGLRRPGGDQGQGGGGLGGGPAGARAAATTSWSSSTRSPTR